MNKKKYLSRKKNGKKRGKFQHIVEKSQRFYWKNNLVILSGPKKMGKGERPEDSTFWLWVFTITSMSAEFFFSRLPNVFTGRYVTGRHVRISLLCTIQSQVKLYATHFGFYHFSTMIIIEMYRCTRLCHRSCNNAVIFLFIRFNFKREEKMVIHGVWKKERENVCSNIV